MAKANEFVVDSSVVAKWFLTEKGTENAIRIRDAFAMGRLKLAVPSLLFYEVTNALRFSGTFKETDLQLAARALTKYKFGVWRPLGRLLELSARLSLEADVTVYDAAYVALAQKTGSKLITEDEELLEKFPSSATAMGSIGNLA